MEIDVSGVDGGQKRWGELTGVDALLVEEEEAMVAGSECGQKISEISSGELAVYDAGAMRNRLQGREGLKGDRDAGESVDAIEEVGVEREAEGGKRQELGRVLRITDGQHTRGGSGRFSEWSSLVKHGDTVAAVVEFKGEREADDSGSSDAQVGVMHGISLVGFGERL